jgi:hypothetical protein
MIEMSGLIAVEKKLQNCFAGGDVEVEGAVHKFELFRAPVQQLLQMLEKIGQGNLANGNVERGKAEFARERTAAGGLDIKNAVGNVVVRVERVGERDLREVWQLCRDNFRHVFPAQKLLANFRELQVGLAGDDMVGLLHDGLSFNLVADFRTTQDDFDLRADAFESSNEFGGRCDVPDVNAEAYYFWVLGKKDFGDVDGALVDVEFEQAGAGSQRPKIGQQIAKAEGGMNVFGIQCSEENVRHSQGLG